MPQDGYPNLIRPTLDRTAEQRRESATAAGRASGESRRRRKTFAEGLRALLAMPEDDPERRQVLQALGLDGTYQDSLNLAQIAQARKGDSDAYRLIRDTIGEKPTEQVELGGLADRPLATIDLSKMDDDALRRLAEMRSDGT